VARDGVGDDDAAALEPPLVAGRLGAGGAVEDLPELDAVVGVQPKLVERVGGERVDHDFRAKGRDRLRHEEVLLERVLVGLGPGVVLADQADR
jgi:hypothetical protein